MGEGRRYLQGPATPLWRRRVPLWAVVLTGVVGLVGGAVAARPSGGGAVAAEVTLPSIEGEAPAPSTTRDQGGSTGATSQGDLSATAGFTTAVDGLGSRRTSVGALVTNGNDRLAAYDVAVVFNLLDDAGRVVDSATESIPYLAPGSTLPVAPSLIGFVTATAPASVQVNLGGTFGADTGWAGASFTAYDGIDLQVSAAAVGAGPSGTEVSVTVTNTADRVTGVGAWSCVLRQAGRIVGGESAGIADPIAPGASTLVRARVAVEGLRADEVICRAWA